MQKVAAVVESVKPESIAAELEVEKGDVILSINDIPVKDLIDYRYLTADENLEVKIKKNNGEEWILDIEKDYDEDLGISFTAATFDGIKPCSNRCVFCFVDQMPPDMRDTLYIKDDDYRLSFLQGNFVTLTNLRDEDIQRLVRMRLSPLYISIHTTNPDLRVKMLGNRKAGEILNQIKVLADAGITMHTQIVLCPGLNDGQELEKTVSDLADLWPAVQSIAVVPVGLTAFREGLQDLRRVNEEESKSIIDQVALLQERFRKQVDKTLVYLSDEFYLKAGYPIPPSNHYDNFEQLENGVGLVRLLYDSFNDLKEKIPVEVPVKRVFIATGVLGKQAIKPLIEELNKVKGLSIEIIAIENRFFGNNVTVTGLVTGSDIITSLHDENLQGDLLIIPSVMCKKGEDLFLDNISLADIEKRLEIPVKPVDVSEGVSNLFEILFDN